MPIISVGDKENNRWKRIAKNNKGRANKDRKVQEEQKLWWKGES